MIITKPHLYTKLEIFAPRYSSKYTDYEDRVVLLAKYKVDHATPTILIEFTKAKHLKGQRYCVERTKAQSCPVESNGTIQCYAVSMSLLGTWDTVDDVKRELVNIGWLDEYADTY